MAKREPIKPGQRYRRGKQVISVQRTRVEGPGPRYVWRERLALLLDDGSWAYTEHWPTNATRKAHEAALSLGYAPIKD